MKKQREKAKVKTEKEKKGKNEKIWRRKLEISGIHFIIQFKP